jgi:hypothetical protein
VPWNFQDLSLLAAGYQVIPFFYRPVEGRGNKLVADE